MSTVELFLTLSTEPSVLAMLLCGCIVSLALAYTIGRSQGSAFLPIFMSLISFFAAATAMFVSGGRVLGFHQVSLDLLASCGIGDPLHFDPQAILNIILFIPFSISLMFASRKMVRTILNSIIVVLSLEFLQTIGNYGVCEGDDVFHNIMGATLGVFIARFAMALKNPMSHSEKETGN
jgi:VanZ like family